MVRRLSIFDLQKIVNYCLKEGIVYVDISIIQEENTLRIVASDMGDEININLNDII